MDVVGRQATINMIMTAVRQLTSREHIDRDVAIAVLNTTAALLMATASLGECRKATPFKPLRPVLDAGGLKWCCEHDPEHCE